MLPLKKRKSVSDSMRDGAGTAMDKIVDLQKQVSDASFTVNELKYHSALIHERYQQELLNIFNDHKGIMTPINVELSKYRKESESNAMSQYKGQIEAMNVKAKAIGDELRVKLMHDLIKIEKEIEKVRESAQQAQAKVLKAVESANKESLDSGAFAEKVRKMKEKWRAEMDQNVKAEKERYAKLIEQGKARMKSLDDTFQKSVADLRKKFFAFSKESAQMKMMAQLKQKLAEKLSELDAIRSQCCDVCDETAAQRERGKANVDAVFQEMMKMREEHKESVDAFEKCADSEIEDMEKQRKVYEEKCAEWKANLSQRMRELEENWAKERDVLAAEMEKAQRIASSDTILSQEELEEYREQLKNERARVRDLIQKDEDVVLATFEDQKMQLNHVVASTGEEKESTVKIFESKKKGHECERVTLATELQSKYEQVKAELEEESNVLRIELEKRRMDVAAYEQNLIVKEALESSIEQIKSSYQEALAMIGEPKDREEWKKELENELKNMEEEQKKAIEQFAIDCEKSVEKKRADDQAALATRKQELIAEYEMVMNGLQKEYTQDAVINSMIEQYNNEYKQCRQELDEISAPSSGDAGRAIDELEKITHEKDDRIAQIASDREQFRTECEERISKEQERHEALMAELDCSKYDESLENIRTSVASKKAELEDLVASLHSELEQLGQMTFPVLTTEEDTTAEQLRADLKVAKQENTEEPPKAMDALRKDAAALRVEIESATKQYFANLELEKHKLETEINSKMNKFLYHEW